MGELWPRVSEASRRYSTATGDSELASLEESLGANLTRMRRFEERAGLSFREAHLDARRGRFRAREGPRGRAGYGARRRWRERWIAVDAAGSEPGARIRAEPRAEHR